MNFFSHKALSVTSLEHFDMPRSAPPYGIAGWTKNDEFVLITTNTNILEN
jgi:hypothetical protein